MNDFLQSLRNGQAEKPRTPKTRKNTDNSCHYTSSPRFNSYGGYQNNRNQHMKRQPMSQGLQPNGNQIPAEETSATLLADALENFSAHIETLVKTQEYMASVQERTADMLERQAIAIESILNHLNISPITEMNTEPGFENHYVTSLEPEEPFIEPAKEVVQEPKIREKSFARPVKSLEKKSKPARPVLRKRKKMAAVEAIAPQPSEPVVSASIDPVVSSGKEPELLSREVVMDIINTMRKQGSTFDQVAKRLIDLGQPTFSGRGEWHAQTIHRLCSKK